MKLSDMTIPAREIHPSDEVLLPCAVRLHEGLHTLPDAVTHVPARVRAVIDTQALAHNYRTLLTRVQAVSPTTIGIAVVKADAYGHGIRPVVKTLLGEGCRTFAVACIEEAVALRKLLREQLPADESDRPLILILGYTDPRHAAVLAAYNITTALLSDRYAAALDAEAQKAGVTVSVHAALDTGMNRIGYPAHTSEEMADTVHTLLARFGTAKNSAVPVTNQSTAASMSLRLDGLFTHFARADEDYDTEMNTSDSLTSIQYARYREVLRALTESGLRPPLCHICNSAAAVRFPVAHPDGCLDAVRLGINLYGYGVQPHDGIGMTRPVMHLETRVSHVHTLLPGETVGYGGTYVSDFPRLLVTLPIGYADGWIRAFSGASVTLHTKAGDCKIPIVGRICMDQCMADITDLPEAIRKSIIPGTPVTLFGTTPAELETLAERAHTIPYELLCLITARVMREYDG